MDDPYYSADVFPKFHMTAERFLCTAKTVLKRDRLGVRDFKAHFGVSPNVAAITWRKLRESGDLVVQCKAWHLLWALCWLKVYASDTVMLSILNLKSEKTYTKWRDYVLDRIYDLEVVRFFDETRLHNHLFSFATSHH
jgi:hypothetical protein